MRKLLLWLAYKISLHNTKVEYTSNLDSVVKTTNLVLQ